MACVVQLQRILTQLHYLEPTPTKKVLRHNTNPIMIYFCELYHWVSGAVDYLILNPIIISSCFVIFCIDNAEIWSRFTLIMVQYYALLLRKLSECVGDLHMFLSNTITHWRTDIDSSIALLSRPHRCNCTVLWRKCILLLLNCLHFVIMLQLFLRLPILITMNKTSSFIIKIQQSEISLLRIKSYYLGQKNKCLSLYHFTIQKRRITEYNVRLLRQLLKYLQPLFPIELIHLVYSFSYVTFSDQIKISGRDKQKMVLNAFKMNHVWVWNRYKYVQMRRRINSFEKLCWILLYSWFKFKYIMLQLVHETMAYVCHLCKMSNHTLFMICIQIIMFALIYSFVTWF